MTIRSLLPFVALLLLGGANLLLASTGSVSGKVLIKNDGRERRIAVEKYTGKISGKVSPPPPRVAGVWLSAPGLKAPVNPPEVMFDQQNYQFLSSLLIIPKGTRVVFPNRDPDYHNVYSLSRGKRFDLGRYKTGERPAPSVTFDKAALIKLRCEIHEHMRADVLVVDSPYYVATSPDGSFVIKGVPAGTYTLHAQLGDKKVARGDVVVKNKGVSRVGLLEIK